MTILNPATMAQLIAGSILYFSARPSNSTAPLPAKDNAR